MKSNNALAVVPSVNCAWPGATSTVWCAAKPSWVPDGRPTPFDTRQLLRRVLADALAGNESFRVGLEVEFHIYRIDDPKLAVHEASWPAQPPQVSLLSPGYRLFHCHRLKWNWAPVRLSLFLTIPMHCAPRTIWCCFAMPPSR